MFPARDRNRIADVADTAAAAAASVIGTLSPTLSLISLLDSPPSLSSIGKRPNIVPAVHEGTEFRRSGTGREGGKMGNLTVSQPYNLLLSARESEYVSQQSLARAITDTIQGGVGSE